MGLFPMNVGGGGTDFSHILLSKGSGTSITSNGYYTLPESNTYHYQVMPFGSGSATIRADGSNITVSAGDRAIVRVQDPYVYITLSSISSLNITAIIYTEI